MKNRKDEKRAMQERDPEFWQRMLEYLPNMLAALLTFAIALFKGLQDGGPWKKALLGALVCTFLSVGLFPLFQALADRYDLAPSAAIAPCVFLGFLGTEWLRNKADDIYEIVVGRWRK